MNHFSVVTALVGCYAPFDPKGLRRKPGLYSGQSNESPPSQNSTSPVPALVVYSKKRFFGLRAVATAVRRLDNLF